MMTSIQSNMTSDSEAWKALRGGDHDAFELLFRRYYDELYHYAVKFCGNSDLAEDHIQQLFLKIWHRRETLGDVQGVKTYLWVALRRSLIDTFRKNKTERKYLDKYGKTDFRMQYSAEELMIHDELRSLRSSELKKAIDQLTCRQREALYLKIYEGMSYEEMEQIMSVSYQTSRNYVYDALQSLKTTLPTEIVLVLLLIGYISLIFV